MERSKARAYIFPATTLQIPALWPTGAGELSGSDSRVGTFWPEPVLRTRAFHLRTDWSDRTNEKRPTLAVHSPHSVWYRRIRKTVKPNLETCFPNQMLNHVPPGSWRLYIKYDLHSHKSIKYNCKTCILDLIIILYFD